jgi:hypothetical protein
MWVLHCAGVAMATLWRAAPHSNLAARRANDIFLWQVYRYYRHIQPQLKLGHMSKKDRCQVAVTATYRYSGLPVFQWKLLVVY